MNFEFTDKELHEFCTTGKSRKYRLQPQVLKKLSMRIQQIEAANDIYDLWRTPSLNFERLKGHDNRFSIRIDLKLRLYFEMRWEDDKHTKGTVVIVEVGSH